MSRLKTLAYGLVLIFIGTVVLWFPNRHEQWYHLWRFMADLTHTLAWAVMVGYGFLLVLRGGRKL